MLRLDFGIYIAPRDPNDEVNPENRSVWINLITGCRYARRFNRWLETENVYIENPDGYIVDYRAIGRITGYR